MMEANPHVNSREIRKRNWKQVQTTLEHGEERETNGVVVGFSGV